MSQTKESINEKVAILNFSNAYCKTRAEVLNSDIFKRFLSNFLDSQKHKQSELYDYLISTLNEANLTNDLIQLFKLLIVFQAHEIKREHPIFFKLISDQDQFIELIEKLYNHWRKLERYSVISGTNMAQALETQSFINANDSFANLILNLYRSIEKNVLGVDNIVFRQLDACVNIGLVTTQTGFNLPKEYAYLNDINFIERVVLNPPFITYKKRNKRSGTFSETQVNPLLNLNLKSDEWFSLGLKVADYFALVYFHKNFMSLALASINLFEIATLKEAESRIPDLIYVFGNPQNSDQKDVSYFKDLENQIYIGYSNNNDDLDYFGYMKKMLLTLHNLKKMDVEKALPIHGAMARLIFKNGTKANVVIIGDSGAGKSETLEAFRVIANDYLKDLITVFDDMGSLKIEGDHIVGYGTEIGAFVRIDDLSKGYPYEQIDRAIFMNPDQDVNARMVIPISNYKQIMQGTKVDYIFQANNYESKPGYRLIDNLEEAIKIFTDGFRMAKGTTSEVGVVSSFFSNPFGAVQEKELSHQLIRQYFDFAYNQNIPVGELFTQLGIKGKEMSGPQEAARALFNQIMKDGK